MHRVSVEVQRALARVREIAEATERLARCVDEAAVEVIICELINAANEVRFKIIDRIAVTSIDRIVEAEDREDEHARLLAAAPCRGRQ